MLIARETDECLRWVGLSLGPFCPPAEDIWQCLETWLVVTAGEGVSATGMQWVETRQALHRTVPATEELYGPKCQQCWS